jgi:CRISPR-associated protein Cmr2
MPPSDWPGMVNGTVTSNASAKRTGEHRWKALDGPVFFEAELRNEKLYSSEQAKPVLEALAELRRSADLGPPAPYYALLLMDGDSLGQHEERFERRTLISQALNKFTGTVQNIVEQNTAAF